jgi:hypothetical protein
MAGIPGGLNQYRHIQLNDYSHQTLLGTPHFAIAINLKSDRNIISHVNSQNVCIVNISPDVAVTEWECRAVHESGNMGFRIGVIIANGGAVGANVQTFFNIDSNQLVDGDGVYRIAVYVRYEGSWW